jgi:predicted molibdopterin-dependent oxidoreductase YjgC
MTEGRGTEVKNVSLTIDGKTIEAAAGTTILEAARKSGIEIPTLCYHPRLRPLGHCRLCVVEIEGIAAPVTSCDHEVQEGMVVTTSTPKLEAIRKEIISLMLSDHPYEDCLTCEKSGNCDLQERAYAWQIELPALLRELPITDDENPYIIRDEAKCVLCGRCYSVCADFARRNVFGMVENGIETRITPVRVGAEALEPVTLEEAGCIFCGQCVDVCPVGALTERERVSAGREWELSVYPGVCVECSLGCAVQRHFAGDRLVRVTAENGGERGGWLCIKGKFTPVDKDGKEEPLTAPLLRGEGGYVEVSYDRALQETARNLAEIGEKRGSAALAVLAGGHCSNEESFLLQKLAREALGTAHIDLGVNPGWIDALGALEKITGPGVCGPSIDDLEEAEAIFVIGERLAESNPVAAMAVERACTLGSTVLIQAGTEEKEIAAWDRVTLKLQPGAEAALFQQLGVALRKKTASPAEGEEADLYRAAQLLKKERSVIIVAPSIFESGGRDWIEPLLEAARWAGKLDRGRNSLLFLAEEGNARGILETGGTSRYRPGYDSLNGEAGYSRTEILASARSGEIKGIFASVEGLKESFPPDLELLAVLCSSRKEIPPEAKVVFPVLPARLKEGTFTNSAGLQQQNSGALSTGGIWPEWQVIAALIRALGAPAECSSLQEVQEEISRIAARR